MLTLDNIDILGWAEWLLETFIPWSMIITGVIVFIFEAGLGLKAEYGRYNKSNKGLPASIAWCLQESPAFLIPCVFLIIGNYSLFNSNNSLNLNVVFLFYFMIHYFNRSYIYPFRINSKKCVNYLENFLAFVFCTGNGSQIAFNLLNSNKEQSFKDWNVLLGSFLFFLGLYINIDSDNRLLRLRKVKDDNKESGYKIPQGGLFEYVSAANYFGECLEWTGFAIAVWSISSFAFALFTWSNIGPRAYHHHLFYKEQFGSKYPPNRKALIPFLI